MGLELTPCFLLWEAWSMGLLGEVRLTKRRAWLLVKAFENVAYAKVGRYNAATSWSCYDYLCLEPQRHEHLPAPLRLRAQWMQGKAAYRFGAKGVSLQGSSPLVVEDLRRPWSTTVTCSEGYGLCERHLDEDSVRSLGRWQERWSSSGSVAAP